MKLVAMMAFYDERAVNIDHAVECVARLGATHVVAVDGAYALFPDGAGRSPNIESVSRVLIERCEVLGLGLTLHVPDQVFAGNEVEKRQLMLDLALAQTTSTDWLMPWDADFHLEAGARDLKPDLEVLGYSGALWADVEINDSVHPTLGWYTLRLILCASRGLCLTTNHYTYRWMSGVETIVQPRQHDAPGHQASVRIRHKPDDRQPGRRDRQRTYYERRHAQEIER